jgi:hypothetical protein
MHLKDVVKDASTEIFCKEKIKYRFFCYSTMASLDKILDKLDCDLTEISGYSFHLS